MHRPTPIIPRLPRLLLLLPIFYHNHSAMWSRPKPKKKKKTTPKKKEVAFRDKFHIAQDEKKKKGGCHRCATSTSAASFCVFHARKLKTPPAPTALPLPTKNYPSPQDARVNGLTVRSTDEMSTLPHLP